VKKAVKDASVTSFCDWRFTEPKGTREAIGTLLVGYYEDGIFKVGTGFNWKTLAALKDSSIL
jgi:hypothetical protein